MKARRCYFHPHFTLRKITKVVDKLFFLVFSFSRRKIGVLTRRETRGEKHRFMFFSSVFFFFRESFGFHASLYKSSTRFLGPESFVCFPNSNLGKRPRLDFRREKAPVSRVVKRARKFRILAEQNSE